MGASKCVAEIYIQSLKSFQKTGSKGYLNKQTKFVTTRFGNVLGSNGSVVSQIENGGSITVTRPEIKRYFMTTTEAVQLVLETPEMSNGGSS